MLASDLLLFDSPVRRMEIEGMLKLHDIVNNPTMRAIQEAAAALEERARHAGFVTPTWADSSYLEQLGHVEALIKRQAEFAKVFTPPAASESLTRLHAQIADFNRIVEQIPQPAWLVRNAAFDAVSSLPAFEQLRLAQFAGEHLQASLLDFDDADTDEAKAERFADVVNAVVDWLDKLPPSWLSRLVATKTVVLILLLMQPLEWAVESAGDWRRDQRTEAELRAEAARDAQTTAALESMRAAIDRLTPAEPIRAIWNTTVPMNLRAAPHKTATRIGVLPAESLVEELDRAGRWMRVLYFDLDTGAPQEAWIYATNLVKQSDAAESE